jgi:hypothetical protein
MVTTGATQGIAVDPTERKVYWGHFPDPSSPFLYVTIRRANLDGSNTEIRYELQPFAIYSVAVDEEHGWIFASLWDDAGCAGIYRFDLHDVGDVGDGLALISGHCAFGVTADPGASKIYWAEPGPDYGIRRADVDGSNVETVVVTDETPYAIDIDPARGKVYWTQDGPDLLLRADVDGSNVETLYTGNEYYARGVALDLQGDQVYWTTFYVYGNELHRADLDGSNEEIAFSTGRTQPGLAIDSTSDGGDGGGVVPAVSPRGLVVLVLAILLASAAVLRRRATDPQRP